MLNRNPGKLHPDLMFINGNPLPTDSHQTLSDCKTNMSHIDDGNWMTFALALHTFFTCGLSFYKRVSHPHTACKKYGKLIQFQQLMTCWIAIMANWNSPVLYPHLFLSSLTVVPLITVFSFCLLLTDMFPDQRKTSSFELQNFSKG